MKAIIFTAMLFMLIVLGDGGAQQPKLTAKQLQQIEDQKRLIDGKGKAAPVVQQKGPPVITGSSSGVTPRELMDEMKALRNEIAELRRELKRK